MENIQGDHLVVLDPHRNSASRSPRGNLPTPMSDVAAAAPDGCMTPDRALFLQNSAQAAAVVILYYDHLLTFQAEVRVIWHRGARRATWAFLLLRYLSFVIYIPIVIFSFVSLGPAACQAYFDARQGVLVLSLLIIAGILSARTYALCECSRRILALMVITFIGLLIGACYSLFGQRSANVLPDGNCHITLSVSTAAHIAAAWECLFAYDTLLCVLTVMRGRALFRRSGAHGGEACWRWRARDLTAVVARDGALYYAAAALVNGANVLTFYFAPPALRGVLTTPAGSLSIVLCARLVLNLHASADARDGTPGPGESLLPPESAASSALLDTRGAFTGLSTFGTIDDTTAVSDVWSGRPSSVGSSARRYADLYELGGLQRPQTVLKRSSVLLSGSV